MKTYDRNSILIQGHKHSYYSFRASVQVGIVLLQYKSHHYRLGTVVQASSDSLGLVFEQDYRRMQKEFHLESFEKIKIHMK
jgi:hypothetical protein